MGFTLRQKEKNWLAALFSATRAAQHEIVRLDNGFSVDSTWSSSLPIGFKFRGKTSSGRNTLPLIVQAAQAVVHQCDNSGNFDTEVFLTIQLLLERGVQVDATGWDGVTALAAAVGTERFKSAKQLLMAGVNPFRRDKNGISPLDQVIRTSNHDLVKLFLEVAAARGDKYDEHSSILSAFPTELNNPKERVVLSALDIRRLTIESNERDQQSDTSQTYTTTDEDQIDGEEGQLGAAEQQGPRFDDRSSWYDLLIRREMRRYYWRTVYPVPQETRK